MDLTLDRPDKRVMNIVTASYPRLAWRIKVLDIRRPYGYVIKEKPPFNIDQGTRGEFLKPAYLLLSTDGNLTAFLALAC